MTEHQSAPDTVVARPRRLERQGGISAPTSERYPQIRCGICEHCGVQDPSIPSEYQYKLCSHFRGLGEVRCSYCPSTADPTEVMKSHTMNVAVHPYDPSAVIAWCNSYDCSRKHLERFQKAN